LEMWTKNAYFIKFFQLLYVVRTYFWLLGPSGVSPRRKLPTPLSLKLGPADLLCSHGCSSAENYLRYIHFSTRLHTYDLVENGLPVIFGPSGQHQVNNYCTCRGNDKLELFSSAIYR